MVHICRIVTLYQKLLHYDKNLCMQLKMHIDFFLSHILLIRYSNYLLPLYDFIDTICHNV